MTADATLDQLMQAVRALVAFEPVLDRFLGDHLTGLAYRRPVPALLPVTADLAAKMPSAGPTTDVLTRAILAAAPHLHWDQSYTVDQVGADHLARYGWFNLVAPTGPYCSTGIRISVGFWGKGLHYARHRHEPEEIYCVLAGDAVFDTDGRPPLQARPGDLIHHPPNISHGFDMADSALLAIAFWKGRDLLSPSSF